MAPVLLYSLWTVSNGASGRNRTTGLNPFHRWTTQLEESMFNRKGFTLIELLIVVVIIGILAAIAIPKFAATKDKAKLASVQTDLRNIITAQEAYFADYTTYGDLGALETARMISLSAGNTGSVTGASNGFTATINNPTISAGKTQCTVQVGGGPTNTQDGVIRCP
jgi:prepilin-type N-terminal cleavage/methylation domain-containing protein